MDASVIICTYNRAAELELTLSSLTATRLAPGQQLEVLVVDNNSTDSTQEVAGRFQAELPLVYVQEARQGKGHALAAGIAAARSDLLLFTDDDVEVDPEWVASYIRAAAAHPEMSFFGGPVRASKDLQPPQWYLENEHWLRANPRIDLGPDPVVYEKPGTARFIGANLAVRRLVQGEVIAFRPDLGPRGHFGQAGARKQAEEFELQNRLMSRGAKGVYVPAAHIGHRDPPQRLTEKYLRFFYREQGKEFVLLGLIDVPAGARYLFGAPAYLYKNMALSVPRYMIGKIRGDSHQWLQAAVNWESCLGQIQGYGELAKSATTSK